MDGRMERYSSHQPRQSWHMGNGWSLALPAFVGALCVYPGEDFLREIAYPLMREAAQFFVDFLVADETTAWLISTPSNSPENGGLVAGPTMDHQIIRQLFRNCIAAADTLGIDADFASVLQNNVDSVAPNQIGQYGQLQEWLEDKDDPDNHHRHVSHLWAVHPGTEINWQTTPELMEAAKKSLTMRGDEGTGWIEDFEL